MSLPNVLVLNRFLDDYLEIRQHTWQSTAGIFMQKSAQFKNLGNQVLSRMAGPFFASTPAQTEVKTEIQDDKTINSNICAALKNLFSSAETPDDWFNIIFELGAQARQAFQRSKKSLLCQALHAMRTYALCKLQEDEKSFLAYLEALRIEKEKLNNEILLTQKRGLLVDDLEAKRYALLYKMADLGDDETLFECVRLGLFQQYKFPPRESCHELSHARTLVTSPEVNIHKPWYYQKFYFHRYHDKRIKILKMESFDDFIDRAQKSGKLFIIASEPAEIVRESTPPSPAAASVHFSADLAPKLMRLNLTSMDGVTQSSWQPSNFSEDLSLEIIAADEESKEEYSNNNPLPSSSEITHSPRSNSIFVAHKPLPSSHNDQAQSPSLLNKGPN